jgi:Protein of unknown function (DUF3443)
MFLRRFLRLIIIGWVAALLSGCGGGSTLGVNIAAAPHITPNLMTINVDSGPVPSIQAHNIPYVSVKLCAHGSSGNCQTIDHVLVDTGSTGLRILASAITPTLLNELTQNTISNASLAECMQFFDGYTWGSVRSADVILGSHTISNMALQVMSDPALSIIPTACQSIGTSHGSIDVLDAKGILGISSASSDCGSACTQATNTVYYGCTNSNCQAVAVPLPQQLQQPISLLDSDNNGTLIQLPALASGRGANITGSLIFGINTQTNNETGATPQIINTLATNKFAATVSLTTPSGTQTYSSGYIDSGTTDWVFDAPSVSTCTSTTLSNFYCPLTSVTYSGNFSGNNNKPAPFSVTIDDASVLFATTANPPLTAFTGTATHANDTPSGTTFLAGLPFFYGKSVWTAIENRDARIAVGPFVAFQ